MKLKNAPKDGQKTNRAFAVDLGVMTDDTIEISISSDIPYLRGFGYEVLEHSPAAIDMSRLLNGASVRNDHDGQQVGVVENAWLDGTKLRATLRFSKGSLGSEIEQDVKDGIRRNVSIGYQVLKWDSPTERALLDGVPIFTATRWQPYHVAFVPDPADFTVGVGRSLTTSQAAVLQEILDSVDVVDDSPALEEKAQEPESAAIEEVVATEEVPAEPTEVPQEEKALETTDNAIVIEVEDTPSEELRSKAEAASADSLPSITSATSHFISQETRMNDNVNHVVNPNIVLTEKEQKAYSLSRALLSLSGGERSGFEFDVSQEIARKTGRDVGSFYVPTSIRSFAIGDSNTGGALTMNQPGEFLDYLRNRTTVAKLGASVMSLPGKVALPKLGGDIAATWVTEDGSGVTITSASLSQVVLSPKKLIAATGYSLETLRVANYSIDSIVVDNMYKSLAVAFDRAAISGSGAAPTGILGQSGLASGSLTSGSAITYAAAVDCWSKVAQANADFDNMAYLTTPQVAAQASTTIRAGSTKDYIMTDDKKIYGYDVAVSNNVPTNAGHYAIFGDWSSLIMAEFGAIEVTVDPYTSKNKGLVEVSAVLLGDIAFKQLGSFAILKNINA